MGSCMRIAVCDTGLGNLRSVVRAIEHVANEGRPRAPIEVNVTPDPDEIRRADLVVVPGQGSFGAFAQAMEGGLGEAIVEQIRRGTPYLGLCLGLQVLFEASDEAPGARGLGVLKGHVKRLEPGLDPETGRARKLPHVGWNAVAPTATQGATRLLPDRPVHFYFVHSFAVLDADPTTIAGMTDYGQSFASAVAYDNVTAVQFHPEKSQRAGLELLGRVLA